MAHSFPTRRSSDLDAQLALLADDTASAEDILRRPELAASRHAADLRHAVARRGAALLHGPGADVVDPKEVPA